MWTCAPTTYAIGAQLTPGTWSFGLALFVALGLLATIGLFLCLFTGAGMTSMHAYDVAMSYHSKDERSFQRFLARSKAPCAEAGWDIAAEDLGYKGGRK